MMSSPQELAGELDALLDRLQNSASDGRRPLQERGFELARQLLSSQAGLEILAERAPRFDPAGLLAGGPWEDPAQLQSPLVPGTLRAPGITPVVESLSELRILAIATGRARSERMSAEEALDFLDEVLARNLEYLLPRGGATEEEREEGAALRESHERLLSLIASEIGLGRVIGEVLGEIEQVLAQRPISTWGARRTIERALRLAENSGLEGPDVEALRVFHRAAIGDSPLAAEHRRIGAYRRAIAELGPDELEVEARALADSMNRTGLVAPHHAVLVRRIASCCPDLLPVALGTGDAGTVEIEHNLELVLRLIDASVYATTAQCLYGLSAALERTLLSRSEVAAGLERLLELDVLEPVQRDLLAQRDEDEEVEPAGVLLAGTIAVLGQPLGVGQGRNPTCQAARGISMWAQCDPAHLIEWIVAAARDGRIEIDYGNQRIASDQIARGLAADLDLELDPVSIALVPHVDRLYSELMRRSTLRLEDAHKWVNPALYGPWVQNELASAFVDLAQTTVTDFESFVRRFFATHHPELNGGHRLMYPNPVGLVITNHAGTYLGPHAVSIQRVDPDPEGRMRVYFFNPNNEGRQDWGRGVKVTVSGHGEEPGESSLPFEAFASRLYAFHYNPNEQGELDAVPDDQVAQVVKAARESWGQKFFWTDAALI